MKQKIILIVYNYDLISIVSYAPLKRGCVFLFQKKMYLCIMENIVLFLLFVGLLIFINVHACKMLLFTFQYGEINYWYTDKVLDRIKETVFYRPLGGCDVCFTSWFFFIITFPISAWTFGVYNFIEINSLIIFNIFGLLASGSISLKKTK